MSEPQQLPLSTRLFALLRTMQLAIIVMSLFYVFLAELLRRNALMDVSSMLPVVITLALVEGVVVVYLKQVKIPLTEETLRLDSEDTAGLAAARKWYVVALACCAGVSLYGFALRVMGATFWLAAIFYASGIALALYCTPRKPE